MTIEERVLQIWVADAAAIALVPASRFKVPGNWQTIARPYVIQYPIAESVEHTQTGALGIRFWDFYQLSVIADSYSTGKAVAEKMRSLYNGNHAGTQFWYLGQRWVGRDETTGTEHIAVEFKIAETLS